MFLLMRPGATPPPAEPVVVDTSTTPASFLRRLIAAWPWYTIPSAIFASGHQVFEALVPVIMGAAIDDAIARTDAPRLVLWCIVLVLNFLALDMCSRFGRRFGVNGQLRVEHQLRMAVTDRLTHPAGLAFTERRSPGELLSIASADVQRTAQVRELVMRPLANVTALLFSAAILLTIDWRLGLGIIVGGGTLVWAATAASAPLQQRAGERQQAVGKAAGVAADLVQGYRTLRGLGATNVAAERYRTSSRQALARTLDANRSEAMLVGWSTIVGGALVVGVAVLAGWMAMRGQISVGELITVVGLTQFISDPMAQLGRDASALWAQSKASAARVLGVLQTPAADTASAADAAGASVDAASSDTPAAGKGLSIAGATINPGQLVVVRSSAPTMSALAQSLAKQPDVLVAPHVADLFGGTVAENVRTPGVSDAAVLEAVAAVNLDPEKETGEQGTQISGGQRQRVALARAVAAAPRTLVLVDPTTAVDSVTEQATARRVQQIRQVTGGTTVVLTSSPAWIAVADQTVEA